MEQENQKFIKFLFEERDKIKAVQLDAIREINDKRIMNINQRRAFFQLIITASLGLSSISFFHNIEVNKLYYYLGFSFLMLDVFIILSWFREILDKEGNELLGLIEKYNRVVEEKVDYIDKFINKTTSDEYPKEYFSGLKELPNVSALKKEIESPQKVIKPQDYLGEMIIFLFVIGALFLFLSVIKSINLFYIFFLVLLVFSLSFQDFIIKIIEKFSKIVIFLHKPLKHNKK